MHDTIQDRIEVKELEPVLFRYMRMKPDERKTKASVEAGTTTPAVLTTECRQRSETGCKVLIDSTPGGGKILTNQVVR